MAKAKKRVVESKQRRMNGKVRINFLQSKAKNAKKIPYVELTPAEAENVKVGQDYDAYLESLKPKK